LVGASRALAWLVLLLVTFFGASSCSSAAPQGEHPVADFGASFAAERKFRPLLRQWILGTPTERQALDRQLELFSERHPGDPLVRLAQVLRGFNAIEAGELVKAKELARDALLGAAGTTRDLATLVVGAAERRGKDYQAALDRLLPLLHKMIDAYATAMLNEELVRAAIGAEQWDEAVRFMLVWLLEASPGRRAQVVSTLRKLLAEIPKPRLVEELEGRVWRGAASEDRLIAKLMAQQLAIYAVDEGDTRLANDLLDEYGPLLGRYGEQVARLAADLAAGRVLGKTVGLVLALGSAELRRRSADAVAGMAYGLKQHHPKARLVTRADDSGQPALRSALEALAAEGAAVIIAAIDPKQAKQVVRFANEQSLPVVLLTHDQRASHQSSPFVFLLGEPAQGTVGRVAQTLRSQGAKVVAGLGERVAVQEGEESFGVGVRRGCAPPPSLAELQAEHVDGLVLYDGSYCDGRAVELAVRLHASLAIGLGVSALNMGRLPSGTRVLSAGVFPLPATLHPTQSDERLRHWIGEGRGRPSWWTALGRDAAVLAGQAVQNLNTQATVDAREVRVRRAEATAALGQARASLWTSASKGFDANRKLPRVITVMRPGVDAGQP